QGTQIAIVKNGSSALHIYTPTALVTDGPAIEIQPDTTNSTTFNSVTSDGVNFWAAQKGSGYLTIITKVTLTDHGPETVEMSPISAYPVDLTFESGYLS